MGQVIAFPSKRFFVEKCDYRDPLDCVVVMLEALTRDRARDEAQAIAEMYEWSGHMVYDEDKQMI